MFKKIALSAAALGALSIAGLSTATQAQAGYFHKPYHHHHFRPFVVVKPFYVAPRPHYVTYGCHYKKQLVDTPWGYKWKVVKVCPGHVW